MISFKKARDIISACAPFKKVKKVRLENAWNRVLAEDTPAAIDGPDFDKSVVDGFAVCGCDILRAPVVLKILEHIPAGKVPAKKIAGGTCSMIATGAMMPRGACAVVMKEDCRIVDRSHVKVLKKIRPKENVYKKAKDFKKGDLLLKKGSALDMAKIALLASQGLATVPVYEAPAIAILTTGDEVIEPGFKKKPGQIWNATGAMLAHALAIMNIKPRYLGIAKDDPKVLLKKIREGLTYDCLIITGAVSMGERDFVPQLLRKLKVSVVFHKVCIRPGKPFLFGRCGRRFIFGLPGNPVSSLVSFLLFVLPAIERMSGKKAGSVFQKGILTNSVYNETDRLSLFPGRIARKPDHVSVEPIAYSGSSDLLAVSKADCFFVLDRAQKKEKNSGVQFFELTL
jgi:molybdopterin molybdotransferase